MGQTTTFSIAAIMRVCPSCGIPFSIPESYFNKLKEHHVTFYCPNGHSMWQPAKSEAEKLQETVRQKENQIAQLQTAKIQLENQLTKVAAGKCPCCGKTFKLLQKHMANKHPQHLKK